MNYFLPIVVLIPKEMYQIISMDRKVCFFIELIVFLFDANIVSMVIMNDRNIEGF